MNKFEEKTLQTKKIYEGRIIRLQVDEVELPNGQIGTREIIKHPGAVAIIPITEDGKIIMVEQYRKALERTLIEIPAGKLEAGEEPIVTAERELEEETGYKANKLEYITAFYTSPGFADELIHIYLATGLEKVEHPLPQDEDEFVELYEVTLDEAVQLMEENKIYDAKTAYAITYLQVHNGVGK